LSMFAKRRGLEVHRAKVNPINGAAARETR
jgi:hypothetical protein